MRILLVQTSFLGDVILSTPVISAIKAIYPESELWIMTTPQARDLVKRDPLITGTLTFDKRGASSGLLGLWQKSREVRAMKFDLAMGMQRSFRTSLMLACAGIPRRLGFSEAALSFLYHNTASRDRTKHDVLRNLQILDPIGAFQSRDQGLRLFAPPDAEVNDEIRAKFDRHEKYVVIVPGSVWATKRWYWEHYRATAQQLLQEGKQVVLLGSQDEGQLSEQIGTGLNVTNLTGRLSIDEMMWVVARAKLMICNDSMALHMASAFKVPTVAIFCATSPDFGFGPWQNHAKVIEKEGLSCKPCSRHGTMLCPTGTWACMRELPPQKVLSAARELLNEAL